MARAIFIFSLILSSISLQAQDTVAIARHTFFLEIAGTGIGTSVNYEYKYPISALIAVTGRAGAGTKNLGAQSITSIPIEVTTVIGRERGHLEIGLGFTPMLNYFTTDTLGNAIQLGTEPVIVPRIGYRLNETFGGFYFRASVTPWIFIREEFLFLKGSICLGYTIPTKEHRDFYKKIKR